MISLNSPAFGLLNQSHPTGSEIQNATADLSIHQQWNHEMGWKNVLNNLRLIIQPTILLWLISPWLDIFPNHYFMYSTFKGVPWKSVELSCTLSYLEI